MPDSLPGGLRSFLVLTRHFFRRFFLNEAVGYEEEMKLKMIAIGALVCGLTGFVSNNLLFKYLFVPDTGQSWLEKAIFLTFLMVLAAFLVVLEWDALLLDREDFQNLMPLPIRPRTMFWSKLASFVLLVGLFTLIANAFAVFAFAVYLPQWQPNGLVFTVRLVVVHILSSLAATTFMFLVLVVLIGIMMIVLKPVLFRWASIIARFLLMLLLMIFLLSMITGTLGAPKWHAFMKGLVEGPSGAANAFPPLWFTGLYERGLGNGDPTWKASASLGILALAGCLVVFYAVFAAGYRRQSVKAGEVSGRRPFLPGARTFLARAFSAIVLRNPIERAVFFFFGRTLARSARHKWMAASIMAVPTALVFVLLSWAVVKQGSSLSGIGRVLPGALEGPLLAAPTILVLFLLGGVRVIIGSPIAPEANWIFRLTEYPVVKHYFVGLKKAVFFLGLIPLFLGVFVVSLLAWGWATAVFHVFFGLAVASLLIEFFFLGFSKVPFACSSVPGRNGSSSYGPSIWAAFWC